MTVTRALNVLNIPSSSVHSLGVSELGDHVSRNHDLGFCRHFTFKFTSQVKKMIQEIEQKRMENVRLIRNKKRSRLQNLLKTPERVEKEAEQAKWKTSKVFQRAFISKLYNI